MSKHQDESPIVSADTSEDEGVNISGHESEEDGAINIDIRNLEEAKQPDVSSVKPKSQIFEFKRKPKNNDQKKSTLVVTLPADADKTTARDIKTFDYRKDLSLPLPPSSDRIPPSSDRRRLEPVVKLCLLAEAIGALLGLALSAGFLYFLYESISDFIAASKCDSTAKPGEWSVDNCKAINNLNGGAFLGISCASLIFAVLFIVWSGSIDGFKTLKSFFNNILIRLAEFSFEDIKHTLKSNHASKQQDAYLKSIGQKNAPEETRSALIKEHNDIHKMSIYDGLTGTFYTIPANIEAFQKSLLKEVKALCDTKQEYDSCQRKLVSIVPLLLKHYSLDPAKLDASDWAVRFKEVAEQLKESNGNENKPFRLYHTYNKKDTDHNHAVIQNVFHPFAVDHNLYYRIDTLFSGNAEGTFNAIKDVRPKLLLMVRQPHTGQGKSFAAKIEQERASSSSEESSVCV